MTILIKYDFIYSFGRRVDLANLIVFSVGAMNIEYVVL
jgi:hypothetical protein